MNHLLAPGIVVERVTQTPNGMGGWSESWQPHLTINGRIRPLSGDERLSADKVTVYATHKLYTFLYDITEKDRVVFEGQVYDVKAVINPMTLNRFLQVDLELVQ